MDEEIAISFKTELGKRIRAGRQEARLRQEDLAAALRVDQGRVSLWERALSLPSVLQLVDIAIACHARPETLIEGIVAPSREQLGLRLDARSSGLLYELTALIVRANAQEKVPKDES